MSQQVSQVSQQGYYNRPGWERTGTGVGYRRPFLSFFLQVSGEIKKV